MLSPLIAGEPTTVDVLEGETPRYTAILVDDQGAPIPAASLDTLHLSLYVVLSTGSLSYVNNRNDQSALNANQVTVDANGVVVWALQVADTTFVTPALPVERHVALWQWTWTSGGLTRAGKHEVIFTVRNLTGVA